jgi:hypothetical protein
MTKNGSWLIVLLVIIPSGALVAEILFPNPVIGGICDHSGIPDRCRLYTAEYNGHMAFVVSGVLNRVETSTETVFSLRTDNGTLYRLIFYCQNNILVTTRDKGNGTFGGYEFCREIPFADGTRMTVDGTLITPSDWNPELSTPHIAFAADLYVFELTIP